MPFFFNSFFSCLVFFYLVLFCYRFLLICSILSPFFFLDEIRSHQQILTICIIRNYIFFSPRLILLHALVHSLSLCFSLPLCLCVSVSLCVYMSVYLFFSIIMHDVTSKVFFCVTVSGCINSLLIALHFITIFFGLLKNCLIMPSAVQTQYA